MLPPIAILCGGMATRLGEIARDVPKSLVPVAGEPFLAHQLRLLRRHGFEHVVLVIGHLGEQIQDFAGDGTRFGLQVGYVQDGAIRRGTGGAVRHALPALGRDFFLTYGDALLDTPPAPIWQAYRDSGAPALMTVMHNQDRWDRSNVVFDGAAVRVHDKHAAGQPGVEWIDWGLSVFSAELIRSWPEPDPFDLAAVTGQLAAQGRLAGFAVQQRFYEIGKPAGLADTEAYLASLVA